MTQSRVERANSSTPSFEGLTPLHLAVLENDSNTVRKIVNERELGVDVRTATGTTALMLAALYGRRNIFLYLLGKKASPEKKDSQGNTSLEYVKQRSPFVQNLVREYQNTATMSPDGGERRDIYVMLKAIKHQSKMAYAQGRAAARHEARAQAQPQTSAHMEQADQQPTLQDPSRRAVFLPSLDGKQIEFVEGRCIDTIQRGDSKTKCIGLVCAADGNDTDMFASSGWGTERDKNVASKNVLNSMQYTGLVKRVATLLDFKLRGSGLDHQFPGTASEKKGAFWACHAEKQLAVFVLSKALSYVSCAEPLTENNLTLLKNQLGKLPPGLRETTIHLNHEIACRNCVQFLDVLTQKTGLMFRIEFHKWYIEGKRSQTIKFEPNGSFQRVTEVTRVTKHSGPHDNSDVVDDELGLFDDGDADYTNFQCDSVDQEGDSVMIHDDPVTPSMRRGRRSSSAPQMVPRELSDPEKRGSPVFEEPHHHVPRYATIDVTPPSLRAQALPTPQSHARFTEIPRITMSPSPVGRSSALGSENQADRMSPSLSQEFEVDEILQAKEENGVQWYLVKWRGYPYDNNSWEPGSNLTNASDAIRKFWEALQAVRSQTQDMDA